ncbi:GNAT family N-acetyltransferase [Micromonospora sp. CPCC 206061]|uniref:GNAT family N-acetyltransferase n=1 Tax=Micromonospora sp. CPCC 206061 TaxID=3122410 RepID=UPI002FF30E32
MRLQPLTAEHRDAILAFETLNREYFAASVPDRGDDFFADYPARHAALLAMQADGTDHFHVLVTEDGTIAGRVNLVGIENGEAELGYRIGRDFAGRGLATDAVRRICDLARADYGLTRLRAAATVDNRGSRTVLLRNGFTVVGDTTLDGQPALQFARDLSD